MHIFLKCKQNIIPIFCGFEEVSQEQPNVTFRSCKKKQLLDQVKIITCMHALCVDYCS